LILRHLHHLLHQPRLYLSIISGLLQQNLQKLLLILRIIRLLDQHQQLLDGDRLFVFLPLRLLVSCSSSALGFLLLAPLSSVEFSLSLEFGLSFAFGLQLLLLLFLLLLLLAFLLFALLLLLLLADYVLLWGEGMVNLDLKV
jgi:hypothetical protein